MTLPDKWLKPRKAKLMSAGVDAWWYGDERGITAHIQGLPGTEIIHSVRIHKTELLKWADDIRKMK